MHTGKKILLLSTALIITTLLWSCGGGTKKSDPNHIKVGVSSGPEYNVAQVAQQVAKTKYGLDVELVAFNDYVMPNAALNQGDLDINVYQHKPFLDEQCRQRGYKLVPVGNTFVFPIAGYSKKIKNIADIQPQSTIVIPNDPTNGGRSLLLLQKIGLLQLKDGVGLLPKVIDITGNPKELRILELEAPQLPRALDDEHVTVAIINNTFAGKAGLVPSRDGLFVEDSKSPYVNLVVAREDNKTEEKVKKFVQAYQSPEVAQAAEKEFKGGAIKGW
ncbi:MAG TPA: methionine ABC transporter substrate-binding lipoprotein MetQ [Chitinophaga sp.]|uniref:methionine ABC transporter substrate-binding lipoprotein MetQ n=1 Tax=Chitinophaga sp. TaxID=1869181 RepID=UPI002C86E7DA|nr:methionine ABC transporter substrate-binding lipoprotein MetQ [Chitinophaga sp.]HVI47509.1 methionine ABC transporter substrate-binding lipoprotein MetQ [Chitinophaga sp.]